MTIGTLKSPKSRNRNGISVIKLKFLPVSSMNTLLAFESHWHETWRHTGRRTVPSISLEKPPPPPPWGTQKSIKRGGSSQKSNPLPFCIPFYTGKVTLLYTFYWRNGTPSSYLELCISFNCCKCTQSLLNMKKSQNHNAFSTFSQPSNALLAILRDLFIDHNNMFTHPCFHIPQSINFLAFHIPEAWKATLSGEVSLYRPL